MAIGSCSGRNFRALHVMATNQFEAANALRAVKIVHTLAWAVFAGCIVALPVAAYLEEFQLAVILIAIVLVEVIVLLANRLRCPLTDVAARYTSDRRANFDIYLPLWVARYNKEIFCTIFVFAMLFIILWLLNC